MSERISTKAGVFESGEKDAQGVQYKDGRLIVCRNNKLEDYTVADGTEVICDRAFMNMKDLRSVTLPDSLKAIGESAFSGCRALADITIPEGVTEIRQATFRDCDALAAIELPASVTEIEKFAFGRGMTTLVVNAPEMKIDRYAFMNARDFSTLMVPAGSADYYRSLLADLRVKASVEEMEEKAEEPASLLDAFMADPAKVTEETIDILKSNNMEENIGTDANLTFPNVEMIKPADEYRIGENEFYEKSFTAIRIPEHVKSIGDWAFNNCEHLSVVILNKDLEEIGEGAFANCDLREIRIPDNVTSILDHVFDGNLNLENVYIGKGISTNYLITLFGDKTPNIIIDPENPNYIITSDNLILSKDGSDLLLAGDKSIESVTIPDSVRNIYSKAFSYCSKLRSVTIPDSVTDICACFDHCSSLEEIHLPAGLDSIDNGMFECCTSLKEIVIPDKVTWIGKRAFKGCINLSSVKMPATIEDIGKEAFANCPKLSSDIVPDGADVAGNAFDCDDALGALMDTCIGNTKSNENNNMKENDAHNVQDNGNTKIITLRLWGEGLRIDVLDSEEEVIDCMNSLTTEDLFEINVIDGDSEVTISKDELGESLGMQDEEDEDYDENFNWNAGYIEDPEESYEDVEIINSIQTKVYGDVEIEIPENETLDLRKIRLMWTEMVLPDSEVPVYCGVLYNGKQYPIILDIDSEREISVDEVWCR